MLITDTELRILIRTTGIAPTVFFLICSIFIRKRTIAALPSIIRYREYKLHIYVDTHLSYILYKIKVNGFYQSLFQTVNYRFYFTDIRL